MTELEKIYEDTSDSDTSTESDVTKISSLDDIII